MSISSKSTTKVILFFDIHKKKCFFHKNIFSLSSLISKFITHPFPDGHPTVTRRSRDGGTTISRQSTDGKPTVM